MATERRSTLDELAALSDDLKTALDEVLGHSEVYERERGGPRGMVLVTPHPFRYRALAREHQPLLRKARALLERWEALAGAAVRAAAPSRLDSFHRHSNVLQLVVELQEGSRATSSTVGGVRDKVAEALTKQRDLLYNLPSAHGTQEVLLVPDTNSAVYQPAFDEWKPNDEPWTLVLVPQVIRELDKLKLRDKAVAEAAASVIRTSPLHGTSPGVMGPLRRRAVPAGGARTAAL